jgi:hypothetical protein
MGLGQRFTQATAVHVLDFPEPEAGDQLAGIGERPVDDRTAGTIERNTLALRGGKEASILVCSAPIAVEEHTAQRVQFGRPLPLFKSFAHFFCLLDCLKSFRGTIR